MKCVKEFVGLVENGIYIKLNARHELAGPHFKVNGLCIFVIIVSIDYYDDRVVEEEEGKR